MHSSDTFTLIALYNEAVEIAKKRLPAYRTAKGDSHPPNEDNLRDATFSIENDGGIPSLVAHWDYSHCGSCGTEYYDEYIPLAALEITDEDFERTIAIEAEDIKRERAAAAQRKKEQDERLQALRDRETLDRLAKKLKVDIQPQA